MMQAGGGSLNFAWVFSAPSSTPHSTRKDKPKRIMDSDMGVEETTLFCNLKGLRVFMSNQNVCGLENVSKTLHAHSPSWKKKFEKEL